jgi:hypothetical protein
MSLSYTSVLAGASGQSSGYSISNSARFVPGNSTYLTRTPSTITSKRILSLDFWVKRATLSTAQAIISKEGAGGSIGLEIQFTAADKINITCEDGVGGNTILRTTTQVFRDVSAWYHIHVDLNSNLTTTSSCLLYVNGSQVTSFTSTTNPGSAVDLGLNTTNPFNIGRRFNASNYFGGYLAQFIYADGTQFANTVAATTNTSGVWVPKALTGITYGAAGFLMEFLNSAALGTDTSGNGNTFTSSGLVAGDQMTDTPTLNYPTMNPLVKLSASWTMTAGNLTTSVTSAGNSVGGSWGYPAGKWYSEHKIIGTPGSSYAALGFWSTTAAWRSLVWKERYMAGRSFSGYRSMFYSVALNSANFGQSTPTIRPRLKTAAHISKPRCTLVQVPLSPSTKQATARLRQTSCGRRDAAVQRITSCPTSLAAQGSISSLTARQQK